MKIFHQLHSWVSCGCSYDLKNRYVNNIWLELAICEQKKLSRHFTWFVTSFSYFSKMLKKCMADQRCHHSVSYLLWFENTHPNVWRRDLWCSIVGHKVLDCQVQSFWSKLGCTQQGLPSKDIGEPWFLKSFLVIFQSLKIYSASFSSAASATSLASPAFTALFP